jgi:hypothetical protein
MVCKTRSRNAGGIVGFSLIGLARKGKAAGFTLVNLRKLSVPVWIILAADMRPHFLPLRCWPSLRRPGIAQRRAPDNQPGRKQDYAIGL